MVLKKFKLNLDKSNLNVEFIQSSKNNKIIIILKKCFKINRIMQTKIVNTREN